MDKSIVVVSRKWKDFKIESFMNNEEVGSKVELDSYLKVMVDLIGNPTLLITKAQLLQKLIDASEVIKTEMKEGTRYL